MQNYGLYEKKNSTRIYINNIYIINNNCVLRPNPEGFIYINWKERKGGGMEGHIQ